MRITTPAIPAEPEASLLLGAIRLQTESQGNFADTPRTLHRVLERNWGRVNGRPEPDLIVQRRPKRDG